MYSVAVIQLCWGHQHTQMKLAACPLNYWITAIKKSWNTERIVFIKMITSRRTPQRGFEWHLISDCRAHSIKNTFSNVNLRLMSQSLCTQFVCVLSILIITIIFAHSWWPKQIPTAQWQLLVFSQEMILHIEILDWNICTPPNTLIGWCGTWFILPGVQRMDAACVIWLAQLIKWHKFCMHEQRCHLWIHEVSENTFL